MPPPPPKMLKASLGREQQIEQLLIDGAYYSTLEIFRAERNKRNLQPVDHQENRVEKKGDLWYCSFCDKTFTTKGSAKRHLMSTHLVDAKQFECPKCTSKFARRDDLYTHLRRMHSANDLVESMIEEHKAELKSEHKGLGRGNLFTVVSHNEHLDVVLPSGNTICRPFSTDMNNLASKEPSKAAKACRTAKCNHWRVKHDDHEDVLVNGELHHKNDDGEWECHGELGSLEDFEFLISTTHPCEDSAGLIDFASSCAQSNPLDAARHLPCHSDEHDLSLEDFDFLLSSGEPVLIPKQSTESLILPGGSVLCRRITSATPRFHLQQWASEEHRHSVTCGHNRMRHGNHYDYIVGNIVESDQLTCPMNGTVVLEHDDTASLSNIISALVSEQQTVASGSAAAAKASASS